MSSDSENDLDWNEELINAVKQKQGKSKTITEDDRIERVQDCLTEGAEIDSVDKNKNTALHIAVKKGYKKLVQFLIEQMARTDISNKNDQTALELAVGPVKEDILAIFRTSIVQSNQQPDDPLISFFSSRGLTTHSLLAKNFKRTASDVADDETQKKLRIGNDDELDDNRDEDLESLGETTWSDEDENQDDDMAGKESLSCSHGDNKYAASGLKQTLHGNIYQLKLLMLFLRRGLKEGYAFRLATEMDSAEKFDDLVFQYYVNNAPGNSTTTAGTVFRFLQAKHKQDETKVISARDLLTEKDDEFSLQKYFISYRKVKKNSEFNRGTLKDFIICTNIGFDVEGLKARMILLEEFEDHDPLLEIKSSTKQPSRYKLIVDRNSELFAVLKRTAEVFTLAKLLIEYTYDLKDKMPMTNPVFRTYRSALMEEVFDVEKKEFFDNFITGNSLSDRAENFRKIFYHESLKQRKSSARNVNETVVWEEIKKNTAKLSNLFSQYFILNPNPKLTELVKFSEEFVKLINNAGNNNIVKIDRKIYRKNASKGSIEKIVADNIDKLAGHVLVERNENIEFSTQFLDDNFMPVGDIKKFRDFLKKQLKTRYNNLDKYGFEINNYKTCDEEYLHSKTELPIDDISDKDIEEFFDKLIFAVNQPNEVELSEIITREIAEDSKFNLLNADLVGDSFQKEMLDWFKEKGTEKGKEGRFLSTVDGMKFFDSAEEKINTFISSGLSLSYPEELREYGVDFKDENQHLRDFLTPRSPICNENQVLYLITTGETLPIAIRVYQSVRRSGRYSENDSVIFMRLRTFIPSKIKSRVISAFGSIKSHHLLIIDCGAAKNRDLQKLNKLLSKPISRNSTKKAILITQDKSMPTAKLKNCYHAHDDVCFRDLTVDSQKKLLGKFIITFQGSKKKTSFRNLLSDIGNEELGKLKSEIDSSTLMKMICGEEIKIGNQLNMLKDDDYIDREFRKCVFLDYALFECQSWGHDILAFSGETQKPILGSTLAEKIEEQNKFSDANIPTGTRTQNQFIILDEGREEEHFKELCQANFNTNVHWIKCLSFLTLNWYKSRGSVHNLASNRYNIPFGEEAYRAGEIAHETITEEGLARVDDDDRKVVIISDAAGMGKSTVLRNLERIIKAKNPELWVIRVDLNNFTRVLRDVSKSRIIENGTDEESIEFFMETLANLTSSLEKVILKHALKNTRGVALLFDGFDEISPDYQATVERLLEALKKQNLKKLVVTTRPHFGMALEQKLGTFFYTMKPFADDNRVEYLVNYWKKGLALHEAEERIQQRLKMYAETLSKKIDAMVSDTEEEFAGIPLQTKLIAEVFQDNRLEDDRVLIEGAEACKDFLYSDHEEPELPENINIPDLYSSFFEKKYSIYSVEKKKEDPTNLAVKEDSKVLRRVFLERHEKMALRSLYDTEQFTTLLPGPEEMKAIDNFIEEINAGRERTGIVTHVINGEPQFVHRTFAEYFAAKYFMNIIRNGDNNPVLQTFIVQHILVWPKSRNLYSFFKNFIPQEAHDECHFKGRLTLVTRQRHIEPGNDQLCEERVIVPDQEDIMFDFILKYFAKNRRKQESHIVGKMVLGDCEVSTVISDYCESNQPGTSMAK